MLLPSIKGIGISKTTSLGGEILGFSALDRERARKGTEKVKHREAVACDQAKDHLERPQGL